MEEEIKQGLPDILFLSLHESGNVIYSFPSLGSQQHVLSSLVSAIFSLGEEFGKVEDIARSDVGDRRLFFKKEGELIFSLFVSKQQEGRFEGLLSALADIVKEEFPGEIVSGMVQSQDDTSAMTQYIEQTIDAYLQKPSKKEVKKGEEFPLSDLTSMMGKEKVIKAIKGFLTRKNLVVLGYDESLTTEIMERLASFWPSNIELAFGVEATHFQEKTNLVIIAHQEQEEKMRKELRDAIFLDFDKPFKERLKDDLLYNKLTEILELTSEESKISMLESELISLNTIIQDIREISSETDEKIPLKTLKKRLKKKHPSEKVNYVLNALVNEKDPLLEKIRTPADSLEETMFFVE